MSTLTIYRDSGEILGYTENPQEITQQLQAVGIEFRRWQANHPIQADMPHATILAAYQHEINKLSQHTGYVAVDVVNMYPDHPDKTMLRQKFLSEHTHAEDEIRFFVQGQGLFTLHILDKVFAILCCKNDLINVPAGTAHWFDMGSCPQFTAIRLFGNPAGWVAQYTGSAIAERFPLLD